jgi:hypothetical protein
MDGSSDTSVFLTLKPRIRDYLYSALQKKALFSNSKAAQTILDKKRELLIVSFYEVFSPELKMTAM